MTHLAVHEWGRVPVCRDGEAARTGAFTRPQANALIAAARAHRLGGEEGTGILADHYTHLTARQLVGVIAAPGCSLEILPKLDPHDAEDDATIRRRLVHMLDVALGLGLGEGAAATMARQNESLLDILIRLFADRLLAEARRGLPRAYLAQETDLPALRGRLDVVRQFTQHAVRPDRLACRFDALSPDIALMQVMKTCVTVLRRHARAVETQRRLDELRFLLADIIHVEPRSLPWGSVRIDRTNRRWETLYGLARLFLKRDWQATHHDAQAGQGISLLFPMNELFEAYVAALLVKALRGSGLTVDAQGGRLFCLIEEGEGGGKLFQTKPDLQIKRGSETVLVIDTKWKRIGHDPEDRKHGVSQGDVYQMMAYGRLYECRELMLLYPHLTGLGEGPFMRGYAVAGGEERLALVTIDLRAGEAEVAEQLSALVMSQFA